LNNENLFIFEEALIYEIKRSYYDAVMQYFKASQLDSLSKVEAERRIAQLIRYPDAPKETIRALNDILESNPGDRLALKMVSEAFIKQEMFTDAFETTVRLDSVSGGGGNEIQNYLRRCRDRKLYREVVKVSEYLTRTHTEHPIPFDYKFYYAEALRGLGEYYNAIAAYQVIISKTPHKRDAGEAMYEIGNIYKDDLREYDSARAYYQNVQTSYRFQSILRKTGLEMAGLYIIEGDLDQAFTAYDALKSQNSDQDEIEKIDYNLAMVEFYRQNFIDADIRFRKMIADYPRGRFLNDAVIGSLLIRESYEFTRDALSDYSKAIFYEVRFLFDSAVAKYRSIIDRGNTPLTGVSIYRLADFYAERDDLVSALTTIEIMEDNYRDDYFYPYCLKLKGDIYSRDNNNLEAASEIYRGILENFGNYPFVGEIRESLQKLTAYQLPG
jgi:tetratricopeptide (TPR) repeat protein